MLDDYPTLKDRYAADDDNTQVLYLKNATATFYCFAGEPEVGHVLSGIHSCRNRLNTLIPNASKRLLYSGSFFEALSFPLPSLSKHPAIPTDYIPGVLLDRMHLLL